ncbi:phosphotransferase enzyme family protein [Streptomyces acidicola]|uniref:phosphotransferase enzyme family protein n=1 Tax=Streptomyces acidicola TaxID=2596892 RepID=UPI0037A006CD
MTEKVSTIVLVSIVESADYLAATYALGSGPWTLRPVTRGAMGQVWQLSGDESSWAVKELLFGPDEGEVRSEATLRDAAAKLGVASPRLMTNRSNEYVSRLPPEFGHCHVKLYDWVEGSAADASDQDVLGWVGRTLALLHQAGVDATETPDSWYQQCPTDNDWAGLLQEARRADASWSGELERFVETSASVLSPHVTPAAPGDLLTSHRDVQPQNVLIGASGPVLLDWDDTGPTTAERELAGVLYVWAGRNQLRIDFAQRLLGSYQESGGPGEVRNLGSFSSFFAGSLNYLYVQGRDALNPNLTDEQRHFADAQVRKALRDMPCGDRVSRLVEAAGGTP